MFVQLFMIPTRQKPARRKASITPSFNNLPPLGVHPCCFSPHSSDPFFPILPQKGLLPSLPMTQADAGSPTAPRSLQSPLHPTPKVTPKGQQPGFVQELRPKPKAFIHHQRLCFCPCILSDPTSSAHPCPEEEEDAAERWDAAALLCSRTWL